MPFGKAFKALKNPVKALTGSSLLNKIFNPHQLVKGLLSPKAPRLPSNTATEQVNDLRAQNNLARLGEPKTILYGLNTKYYPALIQQPWSEFVNGQQELHLRLHISLGICPVSALSIADVPLTAFSGTRFEVLMPGQPCTLFHPNVFVAEQLNGQELVAGIFQSRTYTGTIVFSSNRIAVPSDATSVAARAAAGVNPFQGVGIANDVVVSGSGTNDGTFEVTGFDTSNPVDFIDTDHTFTTATTTASISYGSYFEDGSNSPSVGGVTLTFSNSLSSISAAPLSGNPTPLDIFLLGDVITPTLSGAGANRYDPFTIIGIDIDGSLVVTPPPTALTGLCNVHLLRRYFGPLPVAPPGRMADDVAFDLVWPQGIGGKGGTRDITMRFDAQYQRIDDAGTPTAGWLSFPTIEVTARSRAAYRRSFRFSLPTPGRVQLRLAQVSTDRSDAEILDTVHWVGARGYLVARPGENPEIDLDSTTLAVSLRASNALSNAEDQKINVTAQRWLETWSAGTGWLPESATNAVGWAALDKLRGRYTMRDRQIPDDEIDLPGFTTAPLLAAQYNGQLSAPANLWDNTNAILQLGRGELRYRTQDGKLTVQRDAATAPVMLFTSLNSTLSDYQLQLRTENDPTGVELSYTEPAFGTESILRVGDTDAKPLKISLRNGCTVRQQAWDAVNFAWNIERFRDSTFSLSAELEPLSLVSGDRILVQCRTRKWGQATTVVSRSGRTLVVDPPLVWALTGNTVRLRAPDGSPGGVISCTRLGADDVLLLGADPDVAITGDSTDEARTLLTFFNNGEAPVLAIVRDISWAEESGPGQRSTLNCTVDDLRVYDSAGTAPVDPYAPVISIPSLAITGLTASSSSGTVTASWTSVAAAILYETRWRYVGALSWTIARRATAASAVFTVPSSGMIDIEVRAYGSGGSVGAYSSITRTVTISGGGGGALTVSRTPSSAPGGTTGPICTSITCYGSASGGNPGYSYLWQPVSSPGTITILTPTSASTAFRGTGMAPGEVRTGTFRLRVIDSLGVTAYSANVTVTLERDPPY